MEELDKRKIYLPPDILERIKNDARQFEVLKKDNHTPNMNLFLSKLIIGYYDDYSQEQSAYRKSISEALANVPNIDSFSIADKIIKSIIFPSEINGRETHLPISLKPTRETTLLIQHIDNELCGTDTFSAYCRRMIFQYCKKPIYEREQIIFKDNYEKLLSATNKTQVILFKTIWNKSTIHEIIPYEICVGQDETHNYLLCAELSKDQTQKVKTYRLNRITSIQLSSKALPIEKNVIENLRRTRQFGSQHEINDDEEILVKLTEHGMLSYNRIYTDRPKYDEPIVIDKDGKYNMRFSCSEDQIFLYFRRFQKDDAEIIAPQQLRHRMILFHQKVLNNYLKNDNNVT